MIDLRDIAIAVLGIALLTTLLALASQHSRSDRAENLSQGAMKTTQRCVDALERENQELRSLLDSVVSGVP